MDYSYLATQYLIVTTFYVFFTSPARKPLALLCYSAVKRKVQVEWWGYWN